MKRFLCAFASCLAVAAISVAADSQVPQFRVARAKIEDKIDKDKLVGVWEAKKSALGLPKGTTWEFEDDGTMKLSTKIDLKDGKGKDADGKDVKVDFGTIAVPLASGKYKVEGNKLTITLKEPEKEEVVYKATITKLTDKEFQIKDEKGKVNEFKKK